MGGEKLKDKRLKETKHKLEGVQGKGTGEAVENRKRPLSEGADTGGKAQRWQGVGGGRRRRCQKGARKVPAQPRKKYAQGMRWGEHLRAQPPKKQLQAMLRGEHLRAQPQKKQVQAMRRVKHLCGQPQKKQVQAICNK